MILDIGDIEEGSTWTTVNGDVAIITRSLTAQVWYKYIKIPDKRGKYNIPLQKVQQEYHVSPSKFELKFKRIEAVDILLSNLSEAYDKMRKSL